jgi:hypothetical protein
MEGIKMNENIKMEIKMWLTFDQIELIHKMLFDGITSRKYDEIMFEWLENNKKKDDKPKTKPRGTFADIHKCISKCDITGDNLF